MWKFIDKRQYALPNLDTIILINIAEACLICVPRGKRTGKTRYGKIYEIFLKSNYIPSEKLSYDNFRRVVSALFPIYKNTRKNNKIVKISTHVIYELFRYNNIHMRPIDHQRNSWLINGSLFE